MKSILIALVLAGITTAANAQSDLTVVLNISGLSVAGDSFESLELDVNFGNTYLTANGAINSSDGLSAPATGTCFTTVDGGVFCNLQIDQNSYTVYIGDEGVGTISAKGPDGNKIDEGTIFF